MADASYTQTSFLGGEISKFAQGQFDKPWYKTTLSRAFNLWPSDECSIHRRPGFRCLGVTNQGKAGRLIAFDFSEATPYNLEFTDNLIRMWNNTNLVTTNDNQLVQSISDDTIAVFTLNQTSTWATGDEVYFTFQSAASAFAGNALLNQQFTLTMLNSTQFTVANSVTGYQPGSADAIAGLFPVVNHILTVTTTYSVNSHDWHSVRLVQGYNTAVLLHGSVAPQALEVLTPPTDTTFATFSYGAAQFKDGPYLDPPPNAVVYPNSTASSVQLTAGYPQWVGTNTVYGLGVRVTYNGVDYVSLVNNNSNQNPAAQPTQWQPLTAGSMVNSGQGFVSTDLGRMIRLFYAPPVWNPATTYAAGNNVAYNGAYFTSLVNSNTNNEPDISLADWVINTSIAYWTWGLIASVNSANNITVQLQGSVLLDMTPVILWRLGAWSDTTGWPTCGVYQEGRFWYAGAIPNRVDSSQPNEPFNMAPTGTDGTVSDSNGISYTFNASQNNPIFWGIPDHQGVIWGTQEGEFLMTSGTAGTPMTPSNIQAHRETKYGSSNIQPVRTGLTICFVKRFARRLMEYLADVFSSRFFGNDLTQNARHLGARVIEEIDYQEELIPTVWGRCADGSLIGSTYRRNSLFSNQGAEFNAWHQHALGSGRTIESISVGPSVAGTLDALSIVSNEPSTGIRFVEQMTTLLDETASVTQSWFLDTAITPGAGAANINSLFSSNSTGPNSFDTGIVDPSTLVVIGNSIQPIVASGTTNNPTAVWVGGYINPGASCSFKIEKLDVTTNTPTLIASYMSSTFSLTPDIQMSWALDPSGRYIAMTTSADLTDIYVAIFDTQSVSFGSVYQFTPEHRPFESHQIAWLDGSHLVMTDALGTVRGVQVLTVSGTTISSNSFTSIWGTSSTTLRKTLGLVQFIPNPDGNGVIQLMSNVTVSGGTFDEIFAIPLSWNSGLIVGSGYVVAGGLVTAGASEASWTVVQTDSSRGELTFCYGTSLYCYLMSVEFSTLTAQIIRPWTKIITDVTGPLETGLFTLPIYYSENNILLLLQAGSIEPNYSTTTLSLDPNSFVALTNSVPVTGPVVLGAPSPLRLDAQRFFIFAEKAFSMSAAIISDPPPPPTEITFYGLKNLEGKKVSVFAAGMDCGDYIVTNGQVSVPVGITDPATGWQFNEESFKLLQPIADKFADISVPILYVGKVYNIPCVIGFNYESQGQLCRPQTPQDTGAKNGPGFGKKRRSAKYAIQLVNAVSVRLGTDLNKTKPVPLTKVESGGKKLNYLDMYSGIVRETLEDDYSYDSMLAWKIIRPYPATVTILGAFIETVDT